MKTRIGFGVLGTLLVVAVAAIAFLGVALNTSNATSNAALAQSEAQATLFQKEVAQLKTELSRKQQETYRGRVLEAALQEAFWRVAPEGKVIITRLVAFQKVTKDPLEGSLSKWEIASEQQRVQVSPLDWQDKGILITFSPEFLKEFPEDSHFGGKHPEQVFDVKCQPPFSACPGD